MECKDCNLHSVVDMSHILSWFGLLHHHSSHILLSSISCNKLSNWNVWLLQHQLILGPHQLLLQVCKCLCFPGLLTILLKTIGNTNTNTPCKMYCQYQYQYKFQKRIAIPIPILFWYCFSNTNTLTVLFLILIMQSLNTKKSFYWDSFQVTVKLNSHAQPKSNKRTSPNPVVLLDCLRDLCNSA